MISRPLNLKSGNSFFVFSVDSHDVVLVVLNTVHSLLVVNPRTLSLLHLHVSLHVVRDLVLLAVFPRSV